MPQNIVKDFSIHRDGSVSLKLLNCLYDIVENNMSEKTNMLFQEWEFQAVQCKHLLHPSVVFSCHIR